MNIYNAGKIILLIIIAAVIIAGPLSAKKGSPKQQLAQCRQQLGSAKQQLAQVDRRLTQTGKQLESYKLLAAFLLKRSTQQNIPAQENEIIDISNDDDDTEEDTETD